MCHFITIGTDLPYESLIKMRPRDIQLNETPKQFFKENMPGCNTYAHITDGHCSCDLFGPFPYDPSESEIKKLRKKKWSEEKIRRTLEERRINEERKAAAKSVTGVANQAVQYIKSILSESRYFYIYTHFYDGDIEKVKLTSKEVITFDSDILDNGITDWLPDDTIVRIKNAKHYSWSL